MSRLDHLCLVCHDTGEVHVSPDLTDVCRRCEGWPPPDTLRNAATRLALAIRRATGEITAMKDEILRLTQLVARLPDDLNDLNDSPTDEHD